jgi:hypothetical protein
MSLDRRLKHEVPIKGPRDGVILGIVIRASMGCAGLSAVLVFLQHY